MRATAGGSNVVHLNTLLSSRLICLNNIMNSNKNKTIVIEVTIVSTVAFKNSNGVPTKSAVVKKVSPINIKINFLFIVVVCSLFRNSLATNVWQLQEVGDFEAQNYLPALNLIRSTKLHISTEPAFLPNAC